MTIAPSPALAVARLEMEILLIMEQETPSEYRGEYFFTFRFFDDKTAIDREVLRGLMRSLRNRGFTQYGTGFNEDGMINGAGYSLTLEGVTYLMGLIALFGAD
jgi:hypothetical protein